MMSAAPFSGMASASILESIGLSEDFAEASIMIRPRFEYREMDGREGSSALVSAGSLGLNSVCIPQSAEAVQDGLGEKQPGEGCGRAHRDGTWDLSATHAL